MKNSSSFKGYTIISCGVLHREIDHLRDIGFLDADKILYTDPGLHANRKKLKSQLTDQLNNSKRYSKKSIVVYGETCHPEIEKITEGKNISLLETKDCIDMLADRKKRNEMSGGDIGNTFWLSPGWLDYANGKRYVWERIYKDYLGWDDADAHMNFGLYKKAILVEPSVLGLYNEYSPRNILDYQNILDFSNWTHLVVYRKETSLDRLKDLLSRCIK